MSTKLDERITRLPMGALLDVFASKATPEEIQYQIKMFICENFEHTTQFQFLKASEEIEKNNLSEKQKAYLMNVKICARDISEALDLETIDSLALISALVEEKITIAKQLI